MGKPAKLIVKPLYSDKEMKQREGTWIEESDITHPILESNTDVYRIDENGNEVLLLKFRKNKINCLPLDWNIKVCDISEAEVDQFL